MLYAVALQFLYAESIPIVFLLSPPVSTCHSTLPTTYCEASKTTTKIAQDSLEYYITVEMSKTRMTGFISSQKQLSCLYLHEFLATTSSLRQKETIKPYLNSPKTKKMLSLTYLRISQQGYAMVQVTTLLYL